jgi:hypothetical protein
MVDDNFLCGLPASGKYGDPRNHVVEKVKTERSYVLVSPTFGKKAGYQRAPSVDLFMYACIRQEKKDEQCIIHRNLIIN